MESRDGRFTQTPLLPFVAICCAANPRQVHSNSATNGSNERVAALSSDSVLSALRPSNMLLIPYVRLGLQHLTVAVADSVSMYKDVLDSGRELNVVYKC